MDLIILSNFLYQGSGRALSETDDGEEDDDDDDDDCGGGVEK